MPTHTHAALAVALLAVTGAGGAAVFASQPADAQLTLSGLSITDTQREIGPDGTIQGVDLSVETQYEFESSHEITKAELVLYAAPADGSYEAVDTLTLTEPGFNGSATVDLHGDVTELDSLSVEDFDAAQGRTTTKTIDAKLVMKLYRDGTRVGVADAVDEVTIEVHRQDLTVSGSVAGEGDVTVRVG